MKKLLLFAVLFVSFLQSRAQYWQQQSDFTIDVTLNAQEKTLQGFERIVYKNNSRDTLRGIWFHLWPNAYKSDRTAFSEQMLENGNTRFYFSKPEERGYINQIDFSVDGVPAQVKDHPEHIDIVWLSLPKPLPPNSSAIITTPFHVKLPYNFSRSGYADSTLMITQWFPKPAVYDREGWHPMPYLDQGEFYSEFGNYDVKITVPSNYVVAATGKLQDAKEEEWLQTRSSSLIPVIKKTAGGSKPTSKKQPAQSEVFSTKTLHFRQDSIHDFAWFADPGFYVDNDSCLLPNGRVVTVQSFYTQKEARYWKKSVGMAKSALRFYSEHVGAYPYETVSIVQGPKSSNSGGMEYPTIALITPYADENLLDEVIAHEIGHNWFYGALATNERAHPWMDEGLNTYYEERYMKGKPSLSGQLEELLYQSRIRLKKTQPITTDAPSFEAANYGLSAYYGTAAWLKSLPLTEEQVDGVMQQYYSQWAFRHPSPQDFKILIEKALGADSSRLAELDHPKERIQPGFRFVSPFSPESFRQFIKAPVNNMLLLSPAIGANAYDKLMVGIALTNYKLPPNRLQFLAVPLYSTGDKKWKGIGKINYSILTGRTIRKTDIFLNASSFSMDKFSDSTGKKTRLSFQKLVPGLRFTLKEKDPRSTLTRSIQWKTYLIREQGLNIRPDTLINGTDTALRLLYLNPSESRYVNQLQFLYRQDRALYPFDFNLSVEQSRDFVRPTLTLNSFFNYREGGLKLRFFVGKFIYTRTRTVRREFDNQRYFLQMTGPNGYEDYLYNQYFAGRNEFEGLASQQIMIRDGGFKVRTDLLADKIGRSDNWLTAINLNTSVPDKINPLALLPIKIQLHLFLDIGTEASAWQKDNEGRERFLFDAGLHIPLFAETVNLYFPLFYNKVYGDYLKSTIPRNRLFHSMSFTIDLNAPAIRKLNKETEF